VPLNSVAQQNDTTFPLKHPGDNTYLCPMIGNCCYNPGEDKDENAVVRTLT